MVSLEYDPSSTALYIRIKRGKVASSKPLADNLIVDLNGRNEIIGVEIVGPRPEDLAAFKPKAKILTSTACFCETGTAAILMTCSRRL